VAREPTTRVSIDSSATIPPNTTQSLPKATTEASIDWTPWDELLEQFWHQTIDEDEYLTTNMRSAVKRQRFDSLAVSWPRPANPSKIIAVSAEHASLLSCECHVILTGPDFPLINLDVEEGMAEGRRSTIPQKVSLSTRHAFLIWSDLEALFKYQYASPYRHNLPASCQVRMVWCSENSAETYSIVWPSPPFRFFRDIARFDFAFCRRMQSCESVDAPPHLVVLYHWISLGNKLLNYVPIAAQQPQPERPLATKRKLIRASAGNEYDMMPDSLLNPNWVTAEFTDHGLNWALLHDELEYLALQADSSAQEPNVRQHIREWLIRVALLLMPEVTSASPAANELGSQPFNRLLQSARSTIRAWRGEKFAGFYIKGHAELAESLMKGSSAMPGRALDYTFVKKYFSIARKNLQQRGDMPVLGMEDPAANEVRQ
jgi:hypothetical protein